MKFLIAPFVIGVKSRDMVKERGLKITMFTIYFRVGWYSNNTQCNETKKKKQKPHVID